MKYKNIENYFFVWIEIKCIFAEKNTIAICYSKKKHIFAVSNY